MRSRSFGSTGIEVPIVGQGTWQLIDEEAAAAALRAGVAAGATHIDTAELYRGSEAVIGRAIGDLRDELFLVSKVLPTNASRSGTIQACRKSLERLGTDRLDVYLLHWWSDRHPIEETMRAMAELCDEGLTRHIGVSNLHINEMQAAQDALGNELRIACNQVLYHLGARGIENEVIPYCQEKGIAVVGYSPFGSGNFPKPDGRRGRVLAAIARRHGVTSRQVALNFLTRLDGVFAIPKSESVEHVRQNAQAIDSPLTPEDLQEIEAAFPLPPPGPLEFL